MIGIFEYLQHFQHFQRQVEIFKKHVNTGISSFHNTGFAECLRNSIAGKYLEGTADPCPEAGGNRHRDGRNSETPRRIPAPRSHQTERDTATASDRT